MHNPSVLSPLQCSWSSTGISSAFFHPLSTGLKIVIIFLCANSPRPSPPLLLPGFKPLKKGPGAVRNGKRIRSLSPPVQQCRPATSSQGPELSGGFTWREGKSGASTVPLEQARQAPRSPVGSWAADPNGKYTDQALARVWAGGMSPKRCVYNLWSTHPPSSAP